MVQTPVFQQFIVVVILSNILYLILVDPNNDGISGIEGVLSLIFFLVYFAEMVVKMLAYGLAFKRGAYMRDPWNVLDLAIIVAIIVGYIGTFFSSGNNINLSAFRALRVFKLLRTITTFPKLKALVTTILNSVVSLLEMLFMILITLIIYSITGLQLFSGVYQYQCMEGESGSHKSWNIEQACGGARHCHGADEICGKSGYNPFNGLYSFDNIFSSLLTVYVIVAKEGWSNGAQYMIYNYGWWTIIFFIAIIITETWFMMNLALAIIAAKFKEAEEEAEEEEESLKNKEVGGNKQR